MCRKIPTKPKPSSNTQSINPITFFSSPFRVRIFFTINKGFNFCSRHWSEPGAFVWITYHRQVNCLPLLAQLHSPHHRHLQSELQVVHENKPTSKDSVHEYVINTHMAFLFFSLDPQPWWSDHVCSRLLFKKKCLLWHFSVKCIRFLKQKRRDGCLCF